LSFFVFASYALSFPLSVSLLFFRFNSQFFGAFKFFLLPL